MGGSDIPGQDCIPGGDIVAPDARMIHYRLTLPRPQGAGRARRFFHSAAPALLAFSGEMLHPSPEKARGADQAYSVISSYSILTTLIRDEVRLQALSDDRDCDQGRAVERRVEHAPDRRDGRGLLAQQVNDQGQNGDGTASRSQRSTL